MPRIIVFLGVLFSFGRYSFAEPASEEPQVAEAREAQNPIAHLVTLPLQNNTYFNVGPYGTTQNVLLVQPVIPVKLNDDWVLITRWITPLIYQPPATSDSNGQFGLGNMEPQFYFSPAHPGEVIWGIGPQFWLPTATNRMLGTNKWGTGPAAVALTIQGPWVVGALINNVWAGEGSQRVNQLTFQPFVNFNMKGGWYLVSSPVVTSNWKQKSSERWTVPVGGGIGRLFKVGGQSINTNVQVFSNLARPINAPSWSFRLQVQFLFPKS
ncbi:neuromedin U [Undibacterium terreum]|uniref:neuromedin U n=1 Tax=Undibacterium terreum TaxID=1224302 RepID=UPI0016682BC7|nr:neuromedin U [Undibacterium terreum]